MKPNGLLTRLKLVPGLCLLFLSLLSVSATYGQSSIMGFVYDRQRTPLPDIQVELLNDYYQTIRSPLRTDGTGRYQFDGLRDGRYTVRVYAFRYDLEDQSQTVEVYTQNIRGGEGTGFFVQDFYLNPKKGGLAESEIGVVFAQEVPPQARKLSETALKDLGSKRTEDGVNALHQAIKIFPEYYDALHRLGKELFMVGNYEQAYPFLLKAAEVNQKSATSLYYLGYSLLNLGHKKAAVTALTAANVLAPGSVQILVVLGRAERGLSKFDAAEKHLLDAKKLAKTSIPEIHIELAQLYANDLKKFAQAADELELYLKASKLAGEDAKEIRKKISDLREKSKQSPTHS